MCYSFIVVVKSNPGMNGGHDAGGLILPSCTILLITVNHFVTVLSPNREGLVLYMALFQWD